MRYRAIRRGKFTYRSQTIHKHESGATPVRVVIVGAGQVGTSIAESLGTDHEVVVIDIDVERVDTLTYSLDVLAIEGNGTSLSVLREADIEAADVLIASTDNDEINIVACTTAKTVSDAFTIARIKKTNHFETWQEADGAFGVDFMVSTNLLAAETVSRVIGLPAARNVNIFAEGSVLMAEFCIPEDSPVAGQTVAETDHSDELTLAAILRNERVIIPEGETTLAANDELIVIGSPESATLCIRSEICRGYVQTRQTLQVRIISTDIGGGLERSSLHPNKKPIYEPDY
jgi:trk system potassium uptake protein TrkA